MSCNSGCNTCNTGCNTCPQTNPCATKCKSQITSADLAELVYIAGLDVNLCQKYATIIDTIGLVDCEGNPLTAATPIVTCEAFQEQLCELLSTLTVGSPVIAGTVLVGADCLTHLMPAFQVPITVSDTSTLNLTLAGANISGVVIVSDDAGNIIEIRADGLYANVCTGIEELVAGTPISTGTVLVGADCLTHAMPSFQTPITVADTTCIDLTFAANVLSATPVISPTDGNQLVCSANGLLVPASAAPSETPITALDSASVDIIVSGVNSHTVQAHVRISEQAGNVVNILTDGLHVASLCDQLADIGGIVLPAEVGDIFVTSGCIPRTLPAYAPPVDVNIVASDTNCINTTVVESPANTFTVSSSPILSPLIDNQIFCTINGLYVPPTSPATAITCAALQNVFVDNAAVISPGQRILVDDCQTYLSPTYTSLDTNSVNMTITEDGSGNPVFSAATVIAPTFGVFPVGCNGLVSTASGLSAPPNATGSEVEVYDLPVLYTGAITTGTIINSATFVVNIVNPSPCRSATLVLVAHIPQVITFDIAPGLFSLEMELYESMNIPGVSVTPFLVGSYLRIVDNALGHSIPRIGPNVWSSVLTRQFTVPPGAVGTYSVNLQVEQVTGSCNLTVSNPGVAYYLMTV